MNGRESEAQDNSHQTVAELNYSPPPPGPPRSPPPPVPRYTVQWGGHRGWGGRALRQGVPPWAPFAPACARAPGGRGGVSPCAPPPLPQQRRTPPPPLYPRACHRANS